MKCNQCDRPGFYSYSEGVELCLPCHGQVEDLRLRRAESDFRQQLINMAMINEAQDQMDAAVGFSVSPARIPVAAIAAAAATRNTRMTNINITGAQVGVLNTGDLAKIDAAVTLTKGSDAEELGAAIKSLTEAVVQAPDMRDEVKREVGELLAALTDQVAGKRSKPVATQVLKGIEERAKGVNAVWDLALKVSGLAAALFGIS
jgi:hypothetical protein